MHDAKPTSSMKRSASNALAICRAPSRRQRASRCSSYSSGIGRRDGTSADHTHQLAPLCWRNGFGVNLEEDACRTYTRASAVDPPCGISKGPGVAVHLHLPDEGEA